MVSEKKEVDTAEPVAPVQDADPEQALQPPYANQKASDEDSDSDSEYTYEPGIINQRCCSICCILLALIAAVVCALYFTVGPEKEEEIVRVIAPTEVPTASPTQAPTAAPTQSPTAAPTETPTTAPTSQFFVDIVDLLLTFTPEEILLDSETPQGQALRQLVAEVEASGGEPIPHRILQRYSLMTLYLSTNPGGWSTSLGWNGFGEDECQWYGISTCRLLDGGSYGVSNIELGNNGLTGEFPSEICAMAENLESIDLSGNALEGSIPSCLKDFNKLTDLNLSDNKFSGELPMGLVSITTLKVIDFSQNQLEGEAKTLFEDVSGSTGLTTVRLNDNFLTGGFPVVVTAFSGLNVLQLHANDMTGEVPQTVCGLLLATLTADCDEMTCGCCTQCF